MIPQPVMIRQLRQIDNHSFSIEWSDGKVDQYRLSDLQRHCPCASCNDETTGRSIVDEKTLKSDVKAKRIMSVGRYALRIEFTSGCSTGIYPFNFLRELAKEKP